MPVLKIKKPRKPEGGYKPYIGSKKIKKEIKKIQFLLQKKNDLAATSQQDFERRLKALNLQLSQLEQGRREAKLKDKYKYVRFVGMCSSLCEFHISPRTCQTPANRTEEKKTTRRLKHITRELTALTPSTPEHDQKASELQHYQTALTYINAFPQDAKYIALFPAGQEAEILDMSKNDMGDRKLKTDLIRMKVWNLCKAAVDEGRGDKLLLHARDLEDDKDDDSSNSEPESEVAPMNNTEKRSGSNKPNAKAKRKATDIQEPTQHLEEVDDFFLAADTDIAVTQQDAKEAVGKLFQQSESPEQTKSKKSKSESLSILTSNAVKYRKKKSKHM